MYFVNDKHQQNFHWLLMQYPIADSNAEYQTGFYVVAHPEIFEYSYRNPVSDNHGPFDWYFETDNHSRLPVALAHLVHAGLNLYNNHSAFALNVALSAWSQEQYHVFLQACALRHRKVGSSFTISTQ